MVESNANGLRNRGLNNERNIKKMMSPSNRHNTPEKGASKVMPSLPLSLIHCHMMKPISCFNLALFRITFGLMMAYHMYRAVSWHHTVEANFGFPELNLHFWFARWVIKPRLEFIYWLFYINVISALCMALGFYYRLSCLVFTVGYAYSNMLEKARYNNHFYLYTLIGFLFFITDCHRRLSLDSLLPRIFKSTDKVEKKTRSDNTVPLWQLYIFRFQLSIVYFYAGLAKINYDWIVLGEPMRTWGYWNDFSLFRQLAQVVLPEHIAQDSVGYFFSINGMMFDLFISCFLLVPKLRKIGFTLSFLFHLSNHFLFKIGTFPWVMMTTHVLFLEPETAESFFSSLKERLKIAKHHASNKKDSSQALTSLKWPMKALLFIYVITQLMLPFRHWMYSRDVNWTMEGHQFSWRMMLNDEDVILRINQRLKTGQKVTFNPSFLKLNLRQVKRLVTDSECVLQLVQHIKANHKVSKDVSISVDMWKSLNNRPYQRYANSTVDLSTTNYYAFHYDWILPRMRDDVIDRYQITFTKDHWTKKNFSTSFFMDAPGQSFKTHLQPSNCRNITLYPAAGSVEVKTNGKKQILSVGQRVSIPSPGFHRVTTRGNSDSVWYYVHDCSLGAFHSAQGFLSVPAWRET